MDSKDRDRWMAVHDALQSHIAEMSQTLKEYEKNEAQMEQQVAEENERRDALNAKAASDRDAVEQQIAALRAQIDENAQNLASAPWVDPNHPLSVNPYSEIAEILDEIERVHSEQQKAWRESKEHSTKTIQRVLDMLDTEWPNYPQRLKEREDQIERLQAALAERERIQSEQEKLNTAQSAELQTLNEKKESEISEIERLRSRLKAQEEAINELESERKALNEQIATLALTAGRIEEMQSEIDEQRRVNSAKSSEIEALNEQIATMKEEKRERVENETVTSSQSVSAKDDQIEGLKQKLYESEQKRKRVEKRQQSVEDEMEEIELEKKALRLRVQQMERQSKSYMSLSRKGREWRN